ncbi:MAG: hypothetical protein AB8H80_01170 [Planctomycetota bacterium]
MARAARPDDTPDLPRSLDPDATWIAVRAADAQSVVKALGLRTVLPASWRGGLAAVRSEGVFVAPCVAGWVLAVGCDLAERTRDSSQLESLLPALSEEFEVACWFTSHTERDVHGWALAERGSLVRGYGYSEEHGHIYWYGDVTEVERELGCFVDDPRDRSDDDVKWWPDARIVQAIASAWSLDPGALEQSRTKAEATGWVGRL